MADKKIITDELLKLQTEKVLQVIADNVYQEEEYLEQEIDDMFDATPQEISYYESLINPDVVSENRLWSSKTIDEKLASAILEANKYTDEAATRNLTTEIVTATSEVTKENVLYLILSDASTNTYEQYMLIGGTATALGSTQVDLSNIYNKSEIDTKLDVKANKSEVLSIDSVQAIAGSETNDTVYSSKLTKDELDKKANDGEVVKKTDIATTIDSTSTDSKVASAKAIYNDTIVYRNVGNIDCEDGSWVAQFIRYTSEKGTFPSNCDWQKVEQFKSRDFVHQICTNYTGDGAFKGMYIRTAWCDATKIENAVWSPWQRVCTTKVADVAQTMISSEESSITGTMAYAVKNGKCYVTIWGVSGTTLGYDYIVCSSMPKCGLASGSALCAAGADCSNVAFGHVQGGETSLKINIFKTNITFFGSFSYPVAEE